MRSRGFTLIEALVAIAVASVLAGALAGGLRASLRLWRGLRERARTDQRVRVTLDRLGLDARNLAPLGGDTFRGTANQLVFHTAAPAPRTDPEASARVRFLKVTWRQILDAQGRPWVEREARVLSPRSPGEEPQGSRVPGRIRFEFMGYGGDDDPLAWRETWPDGSRSPRGLRAVFSLEEGGDSFLSSYSLVNGTGDGR